MRGQLLVISLLLAGNNPAQATDQQTGTQVADATQDRTSVITFLRQHCTDCHSGGDQAAGALDLDRWADGPSLQPTISASAADITTETSPASRPDTAAPSKSVLDDLGIADQVITALRHGQMPPQGSPQPERSERSRAVTSLARLQQHLANQVQAPAATTVRRMNRFQYNNAVQDLLGLKIQVFPLSERIVREYGNYFQPQSGSMPDQLTVGCRPLGKSQMIEACLSGVTPFPQDLRAEHGFDNRRDQLSLSPLLLESFLRLARSIVNSREFNARNITVWPQLLAAPETDAEVPLRQILEIRLQPFLRQAFRRPVDAETLNRYVSWTERQLAEGRSFPAAIKETIAAILSSPRFFYLYESQSADPHSSPVDQWQLAERLSQFVWGSIPDAELLDLAAQNRLSDARVLEQQTQRMLRDERLKRFADNFPAQWLQLERIIPAEPDRETFPQFYFLKYRASMHMVMEPLLLFETVLIEDLPLRDLLAPSFSYRSNLLQSWYRDGTQGKPGSPVKVEFQRVSLDDSRYGGVIANAAVLTMTSGTQETKPIARGAWMASVILNNPPPPPPADVPPLQQSESATEPTQSIRTRFAAHRERADCRGCHERIDPLGFALENYDPTGIWRDQYASGHPVDASGVLFGRHQFANFPQLREALLQEPQIFAEAFTRHLMSYALCRELTPLDSPHVRQIVAAAGRDDYRLQSVIREIVRSPLFRGTTSVNLQQAEAVTQPVTDP